MALIDDLINAGFLMTPAIIEAFKRIKRVDFIPAEQVSAAELDVPIPIGFKQTISQPTTVAIMLELLMPRSGDKILDVGSGSGWTAALLSFIVQDGRVFGLEILPELREFAETNISKYNYIDKGVAKIFCLNGWDGLPEFAPFDKIIVSAAAEEPPKKLIEQLKTGGRLVMPLGKAGQLQEVILIKKISQEKIVEKRLPGFVFVPLVKSL